MHYFLFGPHIFAPQRYDKNVQLAINNSTEKIADHLGISDYVSTISTACSSGANAIMLRARLINSGKLDRVIFGGTDSLTKFTINGFNSLMILSDNDCAPFDYNRKGLNLGEGAAFLVLESDKLVRLENKTVLAYIVGYGKNTFCLFVI